MLDKSKTYLIVSLSFNWVINILFHPPYCIFSGFDSVNNRDFGRTDILAAATFHAIHYMHVSHAFPVLLICIFYKIQR